MITRNAKRKIRHRRVKSRIKGIRLCVFRSNQHIYAQLIDSDGKILGLAKDTDIKKGSKIDKATEIGKRIAKIAIEKKLEKVVFDRAGYKYHGRVKAVAEAARAEGLKI